MPERDLDARIQQFLDQALVKKGQRKLLRVPLLDSLARVVQGLIQKTQAGLQGLGRMLRTSSRERQIRQELADHLKDLTEQELERGLTLDEAWARATERFGDIEAYVGELEEIHRLPLIEWLTRLTGLVFIYFWILPALGFGSIGIFLQFTAGLMVIVAPLTAAWIRPAEARFRSWRFWAPRALMLAWLVWMMRQEGGSSSLSLSPLPLAAGFLLMILNRNLNSHRTLTRMRAYTVIAAFISCLAGIVIVLAHLADPARLGTGLATAFVSIIYGLIFGRPSWRWTALYALIAFSILYTMINIYYAHPTPYPLLHWRPEGRETLFSLFMALILGWTFLGKYPARHWLPAAGLLTSIIAQISLMRNLMNAAAFQTRLFATFVPFVLFCLLALGLEIKRIVSAHLAKSSV